MVGLTYNFEKPAEDVLEVLLLGGGAGYGESVVIHFGKNKWMVVDSCVNPKTGECLPLEYLKEIGVDIANDLLFVICTHWHTDHIKGLHLILNACGSNTTFVVAMASDRKKCLYQLFRQNEINVNRDNSLILKEIAQCFDIIEKNGIYCSQTLQDSTIFCENYEDVSIVCQALSPSQEVVKDFEREIIEATISYQKIAKQKETLKKATNAVVLDANNLEDDIFSELIIGTTDDILEKEEVIEQEQAYWDNFNDCKAVNQNARCVTLLISVNDHHIILGSDLEVDSNSLKGWRCILERCQVIGKKKAGLFKIPHHGSDTGYLEEFIVKHVKRQATSKLTTWTGGNKILPQKNMLEKYYQHSNNLFISTLKAGTKKLSSYDRQIKRIMEDYAESIEEEIYEAGIIRSRLKISEQEDIWDTECFGAAIKLTDKIISGFN